jgi:hypothetical protein
MVLIFGIILGVLLLLLAKETVLLLGAILELVTLLVKVAVHLVVLAFLGVRGLYRVVQSHHVRPIRAQRAPSREMVMLVDRGDGVHVPSKREW